MAITIPTPLRPADHGDTDNRLLSKLVNLVFATAQGDIGFLVRGNIATYPKQTSSAPSSSAILTAGGDVGTLAAGDRIYIKNLGTNPLFVKRGTGASTSSANYVLQAGTGADDGKGGEVWIEDFIGVVSATGTSPRFLAWKA